MHIATVGRKYGVHLIVGTQRPDAKVLHKQIRANLPVKVAFAVRDKGNAQVLCAPDAYKIKKNQKGLCFFVDGSECILVQTPLAQTDKYTKKPTSLEGTKVEVAPDLSPSTKEEGGTFMRREELTRWLGGGDPEAFGFVQTRTRINGANVRGYWVKKQTDPLQS